MMHRTASGLITAALLTAGCGTETDAPSVPSNPESAVFAVHLRGDDSSGVALLNGEGDVVDPRFIHSGSLPAGLNQLVGDISLPTQPDQEGVLAIVARSPQNSILRVSMDGEVLSQVSTQLDVGDGAAYSSNPHDYLFIDSETAWVSRYAPNLDPDAKEMNLGDDLIKIDPTDGKLVSRVSLEAFHETIDYELTDYDTGETTPMTGTAYARPSAIVRTGDYALVALDRLTIDFAGQADGAFAVLDLQNETVERVDLKGMGNCGSAIPVLGRDDAAIISCVGVPWGSADSAGLLLVSVDEAGKAEIEQRFEPGDGPLSVFFPVSLGGSEVVVAASGWATGENDKLFRLDLDGGKPEMFFEAGESGVVGFSGAYRSDTGLLLIGDRTEGSTGVRRFELDAEGVTELEMVNLPPQLPVDGVHSLYPF